MNFRFFPRIKTHNTKFKLPKDDVGTHLTTVKVALSSRSAVRVPRVVVGFQSGMLISCQTSHPRMIHTSERIGTRTTVHRGALTSLVPYCAQDFIVTSSNDDGYQKQQKQSSGLSKNSP